MDASLTQFAPMLDNFGVFEARLQDVVDRFEPMWLSGVRLLFGQFAYGVYRDGDMHAALQSLLPLDSLGTRSVLVDASNAKTLCFTNAIDQGGLTSIIREVCLNLRCRGFEFALRDRTRPSQIVKRSRWATYGFSMFEGANDVAAALPVRTVHFWEEYGRWKCEQTGTVQDFEDAARYVEADSVESKRLAISEVLDRIGIHRLDVGFQSTRYWLYRVCRLIPVREVSLEVIRRDLGFTEEE